MESCLSTTVEPLRSLPSSRLTPLEDLSERDMLFVAALYEATQWTLLITVLFETTALQSSSCRPIKNCRPGLIW